MRDGDTNKEGKIKSLKKKPPPNPVVTAAARASCGSGSGGRQLTLLTLGCWPNRRTGGSGSAGPVRVSPGCHLQGSVEVDWGEAVCRGPGHPTQPQEGLQPDHSATPSWRAIPKNESGDHRTEAQGLPLSHSSTPGQSPGPQAPPPAHSASRAPPSSSAPGHTGVQPRLLWPSPCPGRHSYPQQSSPPHAAEAGVLAKALMQPFPPLPKTLPWLPVQHIRTPPVAPDILLLWP